MQGARCLLWRWVKLMLGTADASCRRLGNSVHHIAGHEAARIHLQDDA